MSTTEDHKAEVYELGYLVLPSIPEDSLPNVVSNIKSVLKKAGVNEIAGEDPMHIDLAYTMSKTVGARKYVANDAYLGWVKFDTTPDKISSVKDSVEKIEEILRFLIIKTPRETSFTFAEAHKREVEREAKLEEAEAQLEAGEVKEVTEAVVE
ncbi:30S ribosomal protein S6 [Candidatus Parcubacteria bacterium]|nr:30S ribosomal protein S6 [Candidatus Parcubacteria bacterium]